MIWPAFPLPCTGISSSKIFPPALAQAVEPSLTQLVLEGGIFFQTTKSNEQH